MDRIPFHLQRWRGPKVFSILVEPHQLQEAWKQLSIIEDDQLEIVLYIVDTSISQPFIKNRQKSKVYNEDFFYPINFLRDITIESVRTTHFLLIDVDVFLSSI